MNAIGKRLTILDKEITSGYEIISAITATPLKNRKDLLRGNEISGPTSISWPTPGINWSDVKVLEDEETITFTRPTDMFPNLPAQTEDGKPCVIRVSNSDLRKWVLFKAETRCASGESPDAQWLSNLPIPEDVKAGLEAIERIRSSAAHEELETVLDTLDVAVAEALGVTPADLAYVKSEMKTDPLLSRLKPTWRHISLGSGRAYVEVEKDY